MKTLTIKVPEELDAELRRAAQQRGESKSSLVREAIISYIRGDGVRGPDVSCYDLANDLAASFAGPADLGRNKKKYLKGFGR